MKKFRLVLLAVFFMFVLTPVKAEAKGMNIVNRPTIRIAVGEKVVCRWSTFGISGTKWYYFSTFSDAATDRKIADIDYWGKPKVTITGKKCGTTHFLVRLENENRESLGWCEATIKVVKKPKMSGITILDIKDETQFFVEGMDVVKWWSKNKKVATVNRSGDVIAKKTGKTVIYAKGRNGTVCSKTLRVKHKHKYNKTRTVKPTCTKDGYKIKKCRCGKEKGKTVYKKKLGHKLNKNTMPATCENDGYYQERCQRCSYYKERIIKAFGHDYVVTATDPATCMEDGVVNKKCKRCDLIVMQTLPAIGHHKFGEYVVGKESTCIKNGFKVRYCEVCGSRSESVTLPLSGHDFVLNVKAPRCFEDGLQYNKCKVCGFVQDETVLPGGEEHVFSEGNAFTNYNQFLDSSFNEIGAEYIWCDCGGTKEKRPVPRKDYASEIIEKHTIESLSCFATDYWIFNKDGLLFTANAFNGKEPVDDGGDWNITIGNTDDYLYRMTVNHLSGNEFGVQVFRGVLPEKYDTLDSVSTDESVKSVTVNVPEYVGGISDEKNFKRYWHYESEYGLFLRPCFFDEYVFEDSWFPNGVSHEYYRGFPYQLR